MLNRLRKIIGVYDLVQRASAIHIIIESDKQIDMNVVVMGHIDHGKSTLIGRLLYDTDSITDSRISEVQGLVNELKRRFEFAYFLDSFQEELQDEMTIDTTRVLFRGKRDYTIVDVPGHKEFIRNMLTGASQADVAVLVVSAEEGVCEQTRRHAYLMSLIGVEKVIVVVNKMDAVDYSENYYLLIVRDVREMLDKFDYEVVDYVPASAINGDNIINKSKQMKWYKGMTLIEVLDGVELEAEKDKPFRFVVQGMYKNTDDIIYGRIVSGVLREGDAVIFRPSGNIAVAEKIIKYPNKVGIAGEGDSIGLVTRTEEERGSVAGKPTRIPRMLEYIELEAVLIEGELKKGDAIWLKCGTDYKPACIISIDKKIDTETGDIISEHPKKIKEYEAAVMTVATGGMVAEKFKEIPELGRVMLVKNERNIGAGIVL